MVTMSVHTCPTMCARKSCHCLLQNVGDGNVLPCAGGLPTDCQEGSMSVEAFILREIDLCQKSDLSDDKKQACIAVLSNWL